ncbi:MAG TPA: hypothetical protein VM509_01880, partial [Planctomycetota bacterium]|nr:hypothetical protein [Planctomycetota bacterium]
MIKNFLRATSASALTFVLAGTLHAQNQALSCTLAPQSGYLEVPASPQLVPPSFTLEAWMTYGDSSLPAGWNYPTIARKEFTQG